ncbi:unnamed protein product, partial [Scytosiphon promiscuus]
RQSSQATGHRPQATSSGDYSPPETGMDADDGDGLTPRVPRRRVRASFSMATPPNLNENGSVTHRTPYATIGDSGGLTRRGAGGREGRRGRASFSLATSPMMAPGASYAGSAAGGAGTGAPADREALKGASPWLGGRTESPSTAISPSPATRGETEHFRRAAKLWKDASKAREGSRRRTMGAAPTLEQRMAWRREQEEEEERQKESGEGKVEGQQQQRRRPNELFPPGEEAGEREQQDGLRQESVRPPPPAPSAHERQDQPLATEAEGTGAEASVEGGFRGGGGGGGGGRQGINGAKSGVPPPLPPGTQRAAGAQASAAFGNGREGAGEDGCGGQGGAGGAEGESSVGGAGTGGEGLDRASVRAKVMAIYEKHNKEKLHTVDDALDKYVGRWGLMLQRLEEKYVSDSGLPPASGTGPLCFMDIEVGGEPVGRLVFRLYADKTPKAAENFRALCTGEKGPGLRYEGSAFHRIIPGFVVQGGDYTRGDGRGGKSIYGDKFDDEPFMRHHKLGLLSMANKGPNTNNSQFFITLKAVAHLDGKHVVFGEVQSGINVLDRMKSVTLLEPKRDGKPAPEQRVVIARCGQLNEDGAEIQAGPTATAAPPSFAAPRAGGLFAPPSLPTPLTSTPLFGQPSNLGASTTTTGSIFGAGAPAAPPVASSAFSWSQPSGGAKNGGAAPAAAGLGAAAAPGFGGTTAAASATFGAGGGGTFGGFGSGFSAAAVPPFGKPSAAAASLAAPEGGTGMQSEGAGRQGKLDKKGGSSTPPSRNRYFASAPSDLAAVAVRMSTGTPQSAIDRRASSSRPPGGAAGAAFDRVDGAGTGWVGEEEFEALVGSAGLPFDGETHGRALLDLCSPRLPRHRFLECTVASVAEGLKPAAGDPSLVKESQGVASGVLRATTSPGAADNGGDGGDSTSGDASGSDGSGDEEERREERAKAEAAFHQVDTTARGWVEESQFEALMEAVGTTYSVEDHKPKLLAICKGERLEREAFLTWYMEWLFGDEDSSGEDSEEEEDRSAGVSRPAGKGAGFASLLKSQAGGWRCDACLVSNPESTLKCLSCETVKPGEEGKVEASGSSVLGGSSGASTGGFTFGSPVGSVVAPASETASVVVSSSVATNAAGGFTFGAAPFVPSAGTNATGGFTFGAPVSNSARPSADVMPSGDPAAAGLQGEREAVAVRGDGDSRDVESEDSDDEEERREERAKAEAAFHQVDQGTKGWVEESQFEALMEAVGTTYSVEDHKPKLLAICKGGRLEREAFLTWYMEWLFGDEDSSGEDSEEEEDRSAGVSKPAGKGAGFASLLKSQAGGWRCDACLVSNPESTLKCLSCETVKPGEEGKVEASGSSVLGGSSGASTGGFTFGSPVGSVVAPASETASVVVSSSVATNAAGGFTFGGPPAPAAATAATATPPSVAPLVPSAGTNATGGFTFGAPGPEPSGSTVGEKPAGDTKANQGEENREAAASRSDGDSSGFDSDNGSTDDEEERREEKDKAETAFEQVDSTARGWVEESQFEALMEAVGTTYSVEDHKPKLLAICKGERLEREAFLTWYMEWLFGDEDSSSEDSEEEEDRSAGVSRPAGKGAGFASLLKSQAGGWRCDACLVSNPESTLKCLSCETVKPGEEGKVEASESSVLGGSSGASAGGFTFGSPVGSVVAPASETAAVVSSSRLRWCLAPGPTPPEASRSARRDPSHLPTALNLPMVLRLGRREKSAGDASDDEEERREERAKAEAAFHQVDQGTKGWVEESQFEALMEAVGTTYSVEDHKPKLLAICKGGRLEREAFLTWYMEWLFGDEDSSSEDSEEEEGTAGASGPGKGAGFASLLKSQAGGWRCDACLVSNPESTLKCLSCETVKPEEEGKVGVDETGVLGGSSGAPAGGFTFGSPVDSVVAPASETAPMVVSSSVATNAAGGFTFGGQAARFSGSAASSDSSQDGQWEREVPGEAEDGAAAAGAAGRSFAFGSPSVTVATLVAPTVEEAASTLETGEVSEGGAVKDDGEGGGNGAGGDVGSDGSGDEEERREERAKAETAFHQVDSTARGWVEESQFEALMEAVGTTYSVEDHKPKLLAICKGERLEREAFLTWYMEWLFGDEDSSGEDSEEEEDRSAGVSKPAGKGAGFASLLKSQAGGWRCDACLVSNPESTLKCLSCETVKPGEEGKVEASGSSVLGGSSGASTGGFTFGSPVGSIVAPASEMASVVVSSSVATNAAGGFTFGGPPAPVVATPPATATAVASVPDAPSVPSASAGTNAAGGFTFGAPVPESSGSTAATVPADDAFNAESVDGEREAAVVQGGEEGRGGRTGGDVESDDSDDEEERREERAKAEAAFHQVDQGTKGWVEESQFEALMEAVGTTYSVEDHKPKLLAICKGGRLEREAFLTWYMEWLFGDEDSSGEDSEEEEDRSAGVSRPAGKGAGFSSLLKSQAGGWRCDACLVSNPESTLKCLSCETVKPGEEGKVEASESSVLGGSSGASTGGFTFGSPVGSVVAPASETAS